MKHLSQQRQVFLNLEPRVQILCVVFSLPLHILVQSSKPFNAGTSSEILSNQLYNIWHKVPKLELLLLSDDTNVNMPVIYVLSRKREIGAIFLNQELEVTKLQLQMLSFILFMILSHLIMNLLIPTSYWSCTFFILPLFLVFSFSSLLSGNYQNCSWQSGQSPTLL